MKKFILFCGILAAFLCLSQRASAQYTGQIHRDGNGFVTSSGQVLSDPELISLIGEDIYFETVVGARKQYNTGRRLITGGAIGMGAGVLTAFGGAALFVTNGGDRRHFYAYNDNYPDRYGYDAGQDFGAALGAVMMVGGYTAFVVGGLALSAGLPFNIIGKSRLNWVENQYNDRPAVTCHFGATPSGVGLALQF